MARGQGGDGSFDALRTSSSLRPGHDDDDSAARFPSFGRRSGVSGGKEGGQL